MEMYYTAELVFRSYPSRQSKMVDNEGLATQDRLFYCVSSSFWVRFNSWDERVVVQDTSCSRDVPLYIVYTVNQQRMPCWHTSIQQHETIMRVFYIFKLSLNIQRDGIVTAIFVGLFL